VFYGSWNRFAEATFVMGRCWGQAFVLRFSTNLRLTGTQAK
jgi:hypothetical protein